MFEIDLKIKKDNLLISDSKEKLTSDAEITGFFHTIIEELLELNKREGEQTTQLHV